MPGYEVAHAYGSWRDGRRFGPWQAGEVVDLEPDDADWVCRDSPGALVAVAEQVAEEPEREKPTGRDRQARQGRNRSSL
jgi:hypothetical protein